MKVAIRKHSKGQKQWTINKRLRIQTECLPQMAKDKALYKRQGQRHYRSLGAPCTHLCKSDASLIRDPTCDALLRRIWEAGKLHEKWLKILHADTIPGSLHSHSLEEMQVDIRNALVGLFKRAGGPAGAGWCRDQGKEPWDRSELPVKCKSGVRQS